MGKASRLRECAAVGRAIKPVECGQNRGLNYPCPPECPYCPWGYENYESLRDIDQKIDQEALRYFRDLVGEVRAYNALTAEGVEDEVAFYDRQFRSVYRDPAVDGLSAFSHWEAAGWKGLSGDEIFVAGLRKNLRMEVLEIIAVLDDQQTECRFALSPGSGRVIVRDISLAKTASRGTVMIGRVIPYPHYYVMHGIAVPFEPASGESAAETLRRISNRFGGPDPETKEFLPWLDEHFVEVTEEIHRMAEDRRRAIFENSDFKQCVAVYKLLSTRESLEEKIAAYPEICMQEPDPDEEVGSPAVYDWLRDGRSREWESALPDRMRSEAEGVGSKVWGTLRLFDNRLEIESIGRLRYEPMREMVGEFFGADLEFEREMVVDLGRQVLDGGGSPSGQSQRHVRKDKIPKEFKVAMLEQAFRSHYEKFLSEPVPALKGRTPREAARDQSLRPRLLELMKRHLQSIDTHSRREGHLFNIDWVLDELGLAELKPTGGRHVLPSAQIPWPPIPQESLDTHMQQLFSGETDSYIPEFVFDLVESMPPDEVKKHEAELFIQILGMICQIYEKDRGVPAETNPEEVIDEVSRILNTELLAAKKSGIDMIDFIQQLAQNSHQPALADTIFRLILLTSVDKKQGKRFGIPNISSKGIRQSVSPLLILQCEALIRILSR